MRRDLRITRLLSALLLGLLAFSSSSSDESLFPDDARAIEAYYRAHNRLGSISTAQERAQVSPFLHVDRLPQGLQSSELEEIHELMKQLLDRHQMIDPGISAWRAPGFHAAGPDSIEIRKVVRNGNKVMVHVLVHTGGPSMVLVTPDTATTPGPTPRWLRRKVTPQGAFTSVRQEVHTWRLYDVEWLKDEANIVLLKD